MTLRLRLALWYGGLTGVVVMVACVYSYAVHSRAHYDEMDRTLHLAAEHVIVELDEAPADRRAAVLSASQHLGTAMRLFDGNARIVSASGNAEELPLQDVLDSAPALRGAYPAIASLAPSLYRVDSMAGTLDVVTDRRGHRWRVLVNHLGPVRGTLVSYQNLQDIDESVARFGQLMVLMALVGSVLAFGGGWFVAGRALSPVAVLTRAASEIARGQVFTRRVPVLHPQDELGRLAATFNEMLASLENAYAAQQRFASDASHELRAPLTVLQANLELLGRSPALPRAERDHALQDATVEAERLAKLVADLLALARADAGQQILKRPVELDRVLMDVLGQARHLAGEHRLEVGALEPARVLGDADRLRQLLLVLVDNAIKYTPPPGRIALSLVRTDHVARLGVRDNGVGIAPAALPHVFERFYRADPARSRDPGGTGLGLSIARWITTQHDGAIAVESTLGKGTKVTVTLPVLPA